MAVYYRSCNSYTINIVDTLFNFPPEFNNLADEHWPKNITIVMHGYGVCQAVAMAQGKVYHDGVWINCCGHVELSRGEKNDRKWTLVDHKDVVMPHSLLNNYDY